MSIKKLLHNKFIGGRIFKTGLSALLTAQICILLEWPPLFAVLTAIVSIEPTAYDSIKKGIIRFPAAAIGAAFAMSFEFIWGQSAITYSLSATLTLLVCKKLHLDAGMLVATLTAVAMIPETNGQYLDSFFVRLGTTITGIAVSTMINFILIPPKFQPMILKSVENLYIAAGDLFFDIMNQVDMKNKNVGLRFKKINKDLERALELTLYQRDEWKYRKHGIKAIRAQILFQKQLAYFQKILFHLANLQHVVIHEKQSQETLTMIKSLTDEMKEILSDPYHEMSTDYFDMIQQANIHFNKIRDQDINSNGSRYHHHFSDEMVLCYEVLAIHDVLEELYILGKKVYAAQKNEKW
jgi:uncharacterized membrane protein YgaE (UPF0421/DUF939 family)